MSWLPPHSHQPGSGTVPLPEPWGQPQLGLSPRLQSCPPIPNPSSTVPFSWLSGPLSPAQTALLPFTPRPTSYTSLCDLGEGLEGFRLLPTTPLLRVLEGLESPESVFHVLFPSSTLSPRPPYSRFSSMMDPSKIFLVLGAMLQC